MAKSKDKLLAGLSKHAAQLAETILGHFVGVMQAILEKQAASEDGAAPNDSDAVAAEEFVIAKDVACEVDPEGDGSWEPGTIVKVSSRTGDVHVKLDSASDDSTPTIIVKKQIKKRIRAPEEDNTGGSDASPAADPDDSDAQTANSDAQEPAFEKGDEVEVLVKKKWKLGKVKKITTDGYHVKVGDEIVEIDDGDNIRKPEEAGSDAAETTSKKPSGKEKPADKPSSGKKKLKVGTRVKALWTDGVPYRGHVVKITDAGKYKIDFEDGGSVTVGMDKITKVYE